MRTPILFLLLLSPLAVSSQTFQRFYIGDSATTMFNDVWPTSDGGFIVCGADNGTNSGDHLVAKLDASGQVQWSHTYGAAEIEEAFVIREDVGGGYFACGSHIDFSLGSNVDLLRIDAWGNLLWKKRYAMPGYSLSAMTARQTPSGNYVIGASTSSGQLNVYNFSLFCADTSGHLLWSKNYSDQQLFTMQFVDLTLMNDGSTVMLGQCGLSSIMLIKTDSLGNTSWIRPQVVNGRPSGIDRTSDGGFIVTGRYLVPPGVNTLFLGKFDSTGAMTWMKRYEDVTGNTGFSKTYNPKVKQVEQDYVVSGMVNAASTNYVHVFLGRFSSQGVPQWTKYYPSQEAMLNKHSQPRVIGADLVFSHTAVPPVVQSPAYGAVIRADASGTVGCGETAFQLTATVVTDSTSQLTLTTSAGPDTLAALFMHWPYTLQHSDPCQLNVGAAEALVDGTISLYPNPAAGEVILQLPENVKDICRLEFFDATGKLVRSFEKNANDKTIRLDVSALAEGLYAVRLIAGSAQYAQRLVVKR